MERHGATAVDAAALDTAGFTHLHLSDSMSHAQSDAVALAISRSMMTAHDYFDLKSFSYFPPAWTFERCMDVARSSRFDGLPFTMEPVRNDRAAEPA
jgi:hypothetical protein